MTHINLAAYYLFQKDNRNTESSIDLKFLQYISRLPVAERWDCGFGPSNSPFTILNPTWLNGANHRRYLCGRFVEVKHIDQVDLIDVDGAEESLKIPQGKGKKHEFYFVFSPEMQIALIESKGRGFERKIENFLGRHWETYMMKHPNLNAAWFETSALTIEDSARQYLNDRSVAEMQVAIECEKISEDSPLFPLISQLLQGGLSGDHQLVLKLNLSTAKRGAAIPTVALSNVIDVVENLEEAQCLKSAYCKEMAGTRKSSRLTKLIDIQFRTGIVVDESSDVYESLQHELDELIGDLHGE